jgi:hypothetical protein
MTKVEENEQITSDLAVQNQSSAGLTLVDLDNGGPLPNLDDAKVFPYNIIAEYWTPSGPGDSKKVFFDKIDQQLVKAFSSEDLIELECAFFVENVNGEAKTLVNGSKRLVGALIGNGIKHGTPLLITYLGKKDNKSNSRQSDNWSIKPLIISITAK